VSSLPCPLCSGNSKSFYVFKLREFLRCNSCKSVFTNPAHYLTPAEEKTHYEWHENDPEDLRYQNFVRPLVNHIFEDFNAAHTGLDFGSGTGSPIVKLLEDEKYNISQYDLFFHNHPQVLQKGYDYIACSETAEHFKEPYKEFEQLRNLLLPNGKLYIMTERIDNSRDFTTWYYKDDPTHVFLYHENAFKWIKKEFGFKNLTIDKRIAVLSL